MSASPQSNNVSETASRSRRVLVTGGAGFIGGHLVRFLLERGHQVRVLDLATSPALDSRVEFVRGSILDRPLLRQMLGGVDWVFHLAADPNLWARDKQSFFVTNHQGTRTVLDEAGAAGVERIIHTSTESILARRGHSSAVPYDETTWRTPEEMCGIYCQSKLLAEQEALAAAGRGLPVVVVNPTMVVGANDHRLTPPTRMLLDFLNGRNPAYLEFEMNVVDVADAARGHLLAAERGRIGERYILGGANLRLSEILGILHDLTGLSMPSMRLPYWGALTFASVSEFIADRITGQPPRASLTGVRLACAGMSVDNGKAIRELGFSPTPIREALARAVAWLAQENLIQRPLPHGRAKLQEMARWVSSGQSGA